MQRTQLGRTGLSVSRLCLGTMTFGLQCEEPVSRAIMDTAAEGGIDFFDTADVYPLGGGGNTVGRTEEIVGNWLVGKRHDYIVATKCVGRTGRFATASHALSANAMRDTPGMDESPFWPPVTTTSRPHRSISRGIVLSVTTASVMVSAP